MSRIKTCNKAEILIIFSLIDISFKCSKYVQTSRKFRTYGSQRDSSAVQFDEQPPVVVPPVVVVVHVVKRNSCP